VCGAYLRDRGKYSLLMTVLSKYLIQKMKAHDGYEVLSIRKHRLVLDDCDKQRTVKTPPSHR
jgi:hypothetical protein